MPTDVALSMARQGSQTAEDIREAVKRIPVDDVERDVGERVYAELQNKLPLIILIVCTLGLCAISAVIWMLVFAIMAWGCTSCPQVVLGVVPARYFPAVYCCWTSVSCALNGMQKDAAQRSTAKTVLLNVVSSTLYIALNFLVWGSSAEECGAIVTTGRPFLKFTYFVTAFTLCSALYLVKVSKTVRGAREQYLESCGVQRSESGGFLRSDTGHNYLATV
eukprot:TRINITY_DN43023_c0_g1_i1.p1 TRINITY_DN43023_c0_g1~~TRINITY_DN43023_c0_g1_i1.p1  ORF type:complete len:220 (+),score=66.33 TRINITY_DN43023_c0_g1_i1:57-716(+)